MRKVFAVALVLCVLMCSVSFAAARFRRLPADGVCTGDYVRLREEPNTDSMIMGRLYKGDAVRVLSQTTVKGEVWYEIQDPEYDAASVWVYGKYIRPAQ